MDKPHKIRHIVAFSALKPGYVGQIEEGLKMLGNIPGTINFSVSRNMKLDTISPEAMDVVMYVEFVSENALKDFKKHETYAKCINVVRPLRDKRVVLDF